ncbi:hypothetical protein [Caldalkalibacillus mannanilyticus]|uniref:hypothetical protein n=1 Tax=Caldalkalibacillus mannanilyticus TaxID=1418 RepID=UPI0004695178|nr:hypothetical protein [Caldalkalibacillus mannanilyticus]
MNTISEQTESTVHASLFIEMLTLDPMLRREWISTISQANRQQKKDRSAYANSFLLRQGYETTVEEISKLLTAPTDPTLLPNQDAIQFSIQLLTDVNLRMEWDQAIFNMTQADDQPDLQPVTDFLSKHKVNANPIQISRAIASTLGEAMSSWVNIYGDTTISKDQKSTSGPTLIVTGEFVALGTHRIVGESYDEKTSTLSWSNELNDTSAILVFSRRELPSSNDSYTGNEFAGSLLLPDKSTYPLQGEVAYFGRVGSPQQYPPSVNKDDLETIKNASVVIGVIVTSATALVLGYHFYKFLLRRYQNIKERYRKIRGDEIEPSVGIDLSTDINYNQLDTLIGLNKVSQMGRLLKQYKALSAEEKLEEKGAELLDKLARIRDSMTEEQEIDWENNMEDLKNKLEEFFE